MKVGVFLQTAANDKQTYMQAFAEGVKPSGDEAFIETSYKRCDIALIFGFYGSNMGKIHRLRKQIYDEQQKHNRFCMFLDADLLRFAGEVKAKDANDPTQHLRVSYGSIFPGEAFYFNENSPPDRWRLLCERKKIQVKPYRTDGEHILICMNSGLEGRGWSNRCQNTLDWLATKIIEIREYTSRPIRVRFHPNAKDDVKTSLPIEGLSSLAPDVFFSGGVLSSHPNVIQEKTELQDDCKNAWACVAFTTSASVIPVIEGIPIFTDRKDCATYEVANHNVGKYINSPSLIDREQWFYNLSYSIWNIEEMRRGIVWERFRARLNNIGDISRKKSMLRQHVQLNKLELS